MKIGTPYPLSPQIAKCPECGSRLLFQLMSPEPDFSGMLVECEAEAKKPANMQAHRHWQAEWQPVADKITAHLKEQAMTALLTRHV